MTELSMKRYKRNLLKSTLTWGPFLESPGNLTGPVSHFEIKVARKVCCVLTSNEAHFVSLVNNSGF